MEEGENAGVIFGGRHCYGGKTRRLVALVALLLMSFAFGSFVVETSFLIFLFGLVAICCR